MEKPLIPKLRFPEFKGEWESKKIGNIAELTSSKRVYLNDYVEKGIPFYRGKEISELKLGKIPNDILYITESSYEEFKDKYGVPQKDDLLITAVGTLGNILRIKNDNKFYFKDGNLIWFRKITEYSPFLEIALDVYKSEIEKTSIGSTQRALTMVELRKLKFPFPTIQEQQKISSFLTSIDDRITLLIRQKEKLELYKKGIMQQLFSQEIRFKDNNGNYFPKWGQKKLGEITNIVKGKQLNKESLTEKGSYPCQNGGIEPSGYTEDYNTVENTITISEGGNSCGYVNFIRTKFWCGGHCYSLLKVSNDVSNDFLFQYLKFNQNEVMKLRVGSGLPNIQKGEITNFIVSIPIKKEQQKIAKFLTAIDVRIEQVNSQKDLTIDFKKGLLQQLFV